MALIDGQSIPGSALTALTFTACNSGGDTVAYKGDKKQFLLFSRGGSGSASITITAARTTVPYGRDVAALANLTWTQGNNTVRAVPITPAYVSATTGLVSITYGGVASLTMAVLEL